MAADTTETAMSEPVTDERQRCGTPCLKHAHSCDRSPRHTGWHRDAQQKGDHACEWDTPGPKDFPALMAALRGARAEAERLRTELAEARAQVAEEQRIADDRRTELLEERDSALHNLQEAETDRDRRVEQVNRVRELHKATPDSDACPVCGDDEWLDGECPTIRALDRTEASS